MKKNLLLLCLCIISGVSFAQNTGRFSIKGTVVDSAGVKLPFATVMLLQPQDSSLVNYGRTNDDGILEFKNLKRSKYLLKVNYVGYLPYQQVVEPADGPVTDIGTISMKILNQDLFEVVVKTARAPLSIRGDTVEYNAASFKVPPGSSVEDLLRRLPGMQIEQDGTIRAQGQEVKRVTVDGKRFFGDDPKMATKNLPAEAISKVQVFNGKTEQSRITGVDDGKQEKTVNLELKDSHKKGGFGKATLGVGTDSRMEGKVSYNRFNDKQQLAFFGLGNNTNQSGMSWDDFQDFRGSQSFNWGDDGDFGFSSGGGIRFISGGDGDEESLTIQGGRGGQDRGFTKNFAGGANYNYDTKKTKFSSSYFYNQTDQTLDAFSSRENFLNSTSFLSQDDNLRLNFNGNHRGSLRFEKNLDSLNTLVLISNSRLGQGNNSFSSFQQFFREGNTLTNQSILNNINRFNSFSMGNTAIYRHKFRKKGRNFAASLGYNINNSNGNAEQKSVNEFYQRAGQDSTESITINQYNQTQSLRTQFKGSLLYVEPFAKKFFWETFYNFSLRNDEVDRDVYDRRSENEFRNEQLSRYYTNEFIYNRLGSSVRYSFNGLNLTVGLAAIQFDLQGMFASDQTAAQSGRVDRKYFTWAPNLSLNYDLKNNRYLYANYNLNVNEPNIRDLQPIVDNSNPLYIREGNPDLLPQSSHSLNAGFNYFNPGSFTQLYIGLNYNYFVNQIVYTQQVDENFITRTRPINISGGNWMGSYMGFGFPLKKTKATLNMNGGVNRSNNLTYINNVLNETSTNSYNFGVRMDLTPSDKFTFYPSANWNLSNTSYSINSAQNQKIVNGTYNAEMNVKLPAEMFFNGRFSYRSYVNKRFGFDQRQPILNLSVYKIVLKNKKGEVRFTAYDVFNQNRGITQFASQNFVSTEQVQTLARYYMLSFTYNMRGVTGSVRRRGFF
ncbi:outer membrane beta-barrel family protein [Telluribacter humicola]|uniref:outer membrane beta-barrel family protein n=1 Tax=Telluribacter humicola TaxID=1720261 RepID=UPI001A969C84|nr:outer membrane beta-barrel family protein [Telluribacter humicola]